MVLQQNTNLLYLSVILLIICNFTIETHLDPNAIGIHYQVGTLASGQSKSDGIFFRLGQYIKYDGGTKEYFNVTNKTILFQNHGSSACNSLGNIESEPIDLFELHFNYTYLYVSTNFFILAYLIGLHHLLIQVQLHKMVFKQQKFGLENTLQVLHMIILKQQCLMVHLIKFCLIVVYQSVFEEMDFQLIYFLIQNLSRMIVQYIDLIFKMMQLEDYTKNRILNLQLQLVIFLVFIIPVKMELVQKHVMLQSIQIKQIKNVQQLVIKLKPIELYGLIQTRKNVELFAIHLSIKKILKKHVVFHVLLLILMLKIQIKNAIQYVQQLIHLQKKLKKNVMIVVHQVILIQKKLQKIVMEVVLYHIHIQKKQISSVIVVVLEIILMPNKLINNVILLAQLAIHIQKNQINNVMLSAQQLFLFLNLELKIATVLVQLIFLTHMNRKIFAIKIVQQVILTLRQFLKNVILNVQQLFLTQKKRKNNVFTNVHQIFHIQILLIKTALINAHQNSIQMKQLYIVLISVMKTNIQMKIKRHARANVKKACIFMKI